MGLFKSKDAKRDDENERSSDVAKKDKSEEATPTEQPADAQADEEVGLPEEDQRILAKFETALPSQVFENIQHLMTIMNPNKKGFEEMGGARWSPPIVKIRQAMTTEAPENAQMGNIYTDTGEVYERLEFTPLYMYKTRARFEDENPTPVCRSENAEVSIYGQPCKQCEYYAFKKGERQECAESINVLAFNKDMDQIYHLQFSRTSFRAGFKLFRQASASARMWDKWYALKTEERTRQGSKTKYHAFLVSPTGEKVDPVMYDVLARFNDKITAVRKEILARIAEQDTGDAKQLVDKLDDGAFDAGAASDGKDAPEPDLPDFSTNKNM